MSFKAFSVIKDDEKKKKKKVAFNVLIIQRYRQSIVHISSKSS